MSFSSLILTLSTDSGQQCMQKLVSKKNGSKLLVGTAIADTSAIVLALVFAILAQTSVIAMPPVAAYALFCLAGAIFLADLITLAVVSCKD